MTPIKRKLIEVSLPLEAINRESAREKSIRHGHPSTLHLWWARRPLAACRAVVFAQLVDDPSARPEDFPTVESQEAERQRLFGIIERLVVWESATDEAILKEAHAEILKSTDGHPPAILDPFAGGGSIPLEAQRLGLEARASDLNPVAVLINKAMIEIPPRWAEQPPVFPDAAEQRVTWPKATGLAEDVRRFGEWMRDEADRRIGQMYPKATLDDGSEATVIAWVWARTVTCPNPACGMKMPLVRSWWLSKKKGQEAYIVPVIQRDGGPPQVVFTIGHDPSAAPLASRDGTVTRTGGTCVSCNTGVPLAYVRQEGKEGRIGSQLMAMVANGGRRRHYLEPTPLHEAAASVPRPERLPETELPEAALGFRVQGYGMTHHADLFTPRQLTMLSALTDLVQEARQVVRSSAQQRAVSDADGYADAVALYLGLCASKMAMFHCSLGRWRPDAGKTAPAFGRQTISMIWDFAEPGPFAGAGGDWLGVIDGAAKTLERLPAAGRSVVTQDDAAHRDYSGVIVATDPPYYDNVGYADLADFFYTWLRLSLGSIWPEFLRTVLTPKGEELVADPFRHGGGRHAEEFFEEGFGRVFSRIRDGASHAFPITVFYAFKQAESDEGGTASTGWQTLLEGMLRAGWEVTATWPMSTESTSRLRGQESNALASSIVLALRPRSPESESISRRGFTQVLKAELPSRLRELQQGSIAPVDMAQAAIGPGMAVFSRYARVLEADGSDMTVRTALALINQALDEVLATQEGDFDAETRFAVKWFSQYGWNEAPSGDADVLTRAVNTTVSVLERGGIFRAAAGKARLLEPAEMSQGWNPAEDKAICVWEVAVRLGHALLTEGLDQAAVWMRESASRVDLDAVKELSYLMYSICERKGWAESAMLFNALGTSWGEVTKSARPGEAQREKWVADTIPGPEEG